jgi:hypothetical protein
VGVPEVNKPGLYADEGGQPGLGLVRLKAERLRDSDITPSALSPLPQTDEQVSQRQHPLRAMATETCTMVQPSISI